MTENLFCSLNVSLRSNQQLSSERRPIFKTNIYGICDNLARTTDKYQIIKCQLLKSLGQDPERYVDLIVYPESKSCIFIANLQSLLCSLKSSMMLFFFNLLLFLGWEFQHHGSPWNSNSLKSISGPINKKTSMLKKFAPLKINSSL